MCSNESYLLKPKIAKIHTYCLFTFFKNKMFWNLFINYSLLFNLIKKKK